MPARIGASFLIGALGPVNFAGACILSSKVPEGLRELTPESLFGGVNLGIQKAAARVGVGAADVERLLPMTDIRATIGRIGVSQRNAVEAWNLHAGQLGGFLKGVADLTADGRAPDLGLCLERLAKKLSRDPPLADPLQALAADVSHLQDLIHHCRNVLDDGGALERAYQRRRIRRILLAIVPGVIAVLALCVIFWVRAGQARVGEALALPDPCAVRDLAEGDLSRGSSSQRQQVQERSLACEEQRAREEAQKKEQAAREARAQEEQRLRQEREGRCATLAAHLTSGQLAPDDDALVGDKAPLLRRIARSALEPADLGPADPVLPCGDTPSGAGIVEAFSRAVVATPATWANAEDPSASVRAALIKNVDKLPSAPKQVIAGRAEVAAKKALFTGHAEVFERAVRLCGLKESLGIRGGTYCAGVAKKGASP